MKKHRQVKISLGHRSSEVDEGLAELILEIWKHELDTTNSCQENMPGIAWIEFLTVKDGERFLSLVADKFPKRGKAWKTLYGRIGEFGSPDAWQYNVHPNDLNALPIVNENDEVEYEVRGEAVIFFHLSVRFPIFDIPEIIKRLKRT